MRYLKTNTATIVTVGPFFDKTDGVTLETALTITNEKISATVDLNDGSAPTLVLDNVTGATSGTANDLNYITGCDAGLMQLELAAANVNYVGRFFLTITDAANHVPVFHEFMILSAQAWDAMFGTGALGAMPLDAAGVRTAVGLASANLDTQLADIPTVAEFDARSLPSADYTVVSDLPAAAPTLAEIEASVVLAKEATLAARATQVSVDLVAADVAAVLVDTGATLDAKIDGIDGKVDAIGVELALVHVDADAILLDTGTTLDGKLSVLDGKADTISTAVVTTIPAAVAVVDGIVDTIAAGVVVIDGIVDDILVDTAALSSADPAAIADAVWDEAMAGHAGVGSAGEALAAAGVAGDPMTAIIPGAYGVGTAGKKLGDACAEITAILVDSGTTLDTKLNNLKSVTDAILVDTGTTLDAALAVVDANVDAILVDTGTTLDGKLNTIDTVVDGIALNQTPPTVGAIADAVWDEVLSGHAAGGSAGSKLASVSAGIESSIAGLGSVTNHVTVTVGGVAKSGVDVWVTSDIGGTIAVAGTLVSDAAGLVTFYLDPGTYYVWMQKLGFNFTNPTTLTVV